MAAPIDGERDLERSDSVTNPSTQFSTEERTGGLEIQRLIADDDVDLLCPINYVYDFLPSSMLWLNPQPVSLPTSVASALEERWPESLHGNPRSIRLSPREAGLPIRTGLTQFRQSRHWKVGVQAAERLLRLFAQDQHCAEVTLEKGESIAGQASKQLAVSAVDTLGRYIVYMGAEADHTRVQLLMQSMVLIFVFDGISFTSDPPR